MSHKGQSGRTVSRRSHAAKAEPVSLPTFSHNRPLAERILGEKSDKEEVKRRLRPLLEQVRRQDPNERMVVEHEVLTREGLTLFAGMSDFYSRVFLALKILAAERGVFVEASEYFREREVLTMLGDILHVLDVHGKAIYLVGNTETAAHYPSAQTCFWTVPETREWYSAISIFVERLKVLAKETCEFLFNGLPPGGSNSVFAKTTRERMDAFLSLLAERPSIAGVLSSLPFADGVSPGNKQVHGLWFALRCRDLLKLRGLDRRGFVTRYLANYLRSCAVHELAHSFFNDAARATGHEAVAADVELNELFAASIEIACGPTPFASLANAFLLSEKKKAGDAFFHDELMTSVYLALQQHGTRFRNPNALLCASEGELRAITARISSSMMHGYMSLSLAQAAPLGHFMEAQRQIEEIAGEL